ncbi:hypothetical protein CVT26_000716 [Gymnopilus dilepis]|uniref:Uncharacterized protein n=1 Tax=Gymnopilus dilepis TaxID=231916 RepID=A0A409Y2E2_9AGAR|nr:hypothetical protein CVT26_000716 [Gymnopilus dilepis]
MSEIGYTPLGALGHFRGKAVVFRARTDRQAMDYIGSPYETTKSQKSDAERLPEKYRPSILELPRD